MKNFIKFKEKDFLKAYLCIGSEVEKISNCKVKRTKIGNTVFFIVNNYYILNGECSCNKNLCWHSISTFLHPNAPFVVLR